MPRKRANLTATAEALTVSEPLPIEDLEESTVEEYKKLNDKLDTIITKISDRKTRKKKKK